MNQHEMPNEVLEGERVALSFVEVEDSEELLYLVDSSRESLNPWLSWVENFCTIQDAYSAISAYDLQRNMGNGGAFSIRRLDDGALIGEVVLQWIDWNNRSTGLEYFVGSEFEGEGLATESVNLVLGYLQKLGMHRVEISAATENAKSNSLAKRVGFELEGMAKDAEFLHGMFVNHNRYARILQEK